MTAARAVGIMGPGGPEVVTVIEREIPGAMGTGCDAAARRSPPGGSRRARRDGIWGLCAGPSAGAAGQGLPRRQGPPDRDDRHDRLPDRRQHRQIGVGVGVCETPVEINPVPGREVLQPGGAGLPNQRWPGQEPGAPAVGVGGEVGGHDHVEQWSQRAGQRAHHPGDQDRRVSGVAVLTNPADRLG